jgi:hypothetical protein
VPSLAADTSGYQSYLFGSVRGSAVAAVDLMNRTASVALDNAVGAATMAAPLLSLEAEAAAVAFEFTASTSGYRFSIALTSSLLALFTQISALGSLLYSALRVAMRRLEYVVDFDAHASTQFESEMAESVAQFDGPRGAEPVVSTAPTVGEIELVHGVDLTSDHDNASPLPCESALQVVPMLQPNPIFSAKVEPCFVSASAAGAIVASDNAVIVASHIDLNVVNDAGVAHSEAAGISAGEDSMVESAQQPRVDAAALVVLRSPPPPHVSRHKMALPLAIDTELAASSLPTLRSVATAPIALGSDVISASPVSVDHRAIPFSDPPAMVLLRALHPYTAAFDDELSTPPGTIVKVDVAATRAHGDDEWAVVTVVGGPHDGARGAVPLNHFEQFVSVP